MKQYKFKSDYSTVIVKAIVDGYRDYVEHRKDRRAKMEISSAFAWTKGNFIESKMAEVSGDINLKYKKARAGLTWEYLQFIHGDTRKLFMIRNAAYFNENSFSQAILPNKYKSNQPKRTYLHDLSKINHNLNFPEQLKFITTHSSDKNKKSTQLTLSIPEEMANNELDQLYSLYDEFHILTYKIDNAYQISEIMHYLPNPADNKAYEVEDLSEYISGAELTDDEKNTLAPETGDELIDPSEFDIGIIEEEKER